MTAVTLSPVTNPGGWCGKTSVVTTLWCCYSIWFGSCSTRAPRGRGLLVGNHIVDASRVLYVLCGVSCWPISTGQLHESLVLASTSGLSTQWSGWGPLTHKVYGNLISKRASRLDAFSGYPIRT